MTRRDIEVVCLSVCPSVCPVPVLCLKRLHILSGGVSL